MKRFGFYGRHCQKESASVLMRQKIGVNASFMSGIHSGQERQQANSET